MAATDFDVPSGHDHGHDMRWTTDPTREEFDHLVQQAQVHGPQCITRNGKAIAYIISADRFQIMQGTTGEALIDVMASMPHKDIALSVNEDEHSGDSALRPIDARLAIERLKAVRASVSEGDGHSSELIDEGRR